MRSGLRVHGCPVRSRAGDLIDRFRSGGVLDIKWAFQNPRIVSVRVHVPGFAEMWRALVPNFVFFASGFQKSLLEKARDLPVFAVHADDPRPAQFSDGLQAEINGSVVKAEITLAFALG